MILYIGRTPFLYNVTVTSAGTLACSLSIVIHIKASYSFLCSYVDYICTHHLSNEDADDSLYTPDEKIHSYQSITQHNGNTVSIDINILDYSVNL